MYQLPDDSIATGYKQTRPFQFEQTFYSVTHNFTGTEKEFAIKGMGYKYRQIDKHTRVVID